MANIKLALHLEGKLIKILRLPGIIVCDGNAFEAIFFEFAPKTNSFISVKTHNRLVCVNRQKIHTFSVNINM